MAINWRLALGYGTLSSAVLAVLLWLSYGFYAQELYNGIDRVLLRAAERTAPAARQGQDLEPLINRNSEVLTVVRLYDPQGRLKGSTHPWIEDELAPLDPAQALKLPSLPGYAPLRYMPTVQPPLWRIAEGRFSLRMSRSGRWRVLVWPLSNPPSNPLTGYLEILTPLGQPDQAMAQVRRVLLGLGLGGSLLTFLLGLVMAQRLLRPVRQLTQAAQDIASSKDLSRRVALPPSHDELAHLAETFNRMLASLEAEQNRLSLAFEAAEMGWWEWEIQTDTHRWSPGFERLLGLQPGTFRGGSEAFLERVHPEDRARVRQVIEQSTQQGQPRPREFEYRVLRGGQVCWIASRARVFYDQAGHPARLIGLELDITARQQAAQRAVMLQTLSTRLSVALTPEQVAQVVLEQGLPALGARAGSVALLDGQTLELLEQKNYLQTDHQRWARFPVSLPTPLGQAVRSGQAVWLGSGEEFVRLMGRPPSSDSGGLDQAWAALPLLVEGQPIGALGLAYSSPQAFDLPERTFALTLADLCAQALERAKLFEAEHRARQHWQQSLARLQRIQTITEKLLEPLSPERIFEVILHHGLDVLGGTAGVLRLVSADGLKLETVGVISPNEAIARDYRDLALEADIPSAEAARTRQLLFFPSKAALLERYPHLSEVVQGFVTQASVYLPLLIEDRLLGTLTLDFLHKPDLDEEERGYLMSLSRITAQALERARLYEALRRNNAQLEAMLDNLPVGLAFFDRELRFVRLNPALAEINQLPLEAQLGRRVSELGPAGQLIESRLEQVFRSGEGIYNLEVSGPSIHDPQDIRYSLASWYPIKLEGQTILVGASVLDITERKRAEQALLRNEERMRLAIEANRMVAWEWDVQQDRIITSDNFAEIYGLDKLAGVSEGFGLVWSEDLPAHQEKVERVMRQGGEYHSEFRITRPADGRTVWLEERAKALLDSQGKVKRMVGIVIDVTERRQAEETIRYQAKLLDAVDQAVIATDRAGTIVYWNRYAEELYGWKAQEALGKRVQEITPASFSKDQAEAIMAVLQQGKSWSGEFSVQRKDGTVFPAMVTDSPIWDSQGRQIGVVGVSVDISLRRQAEETLRESQQRLSLALESGRMGAWDWDLKSGIEQWSPEQERLFGLEPGSGVHSIGEFFSLVHPEDRERIRARADQATQDGESFIEDEFRVILPDGQVIWIASRAQLHRDSSGQVVRMTGVNLDVTERKRVEERLVALASVTSHLVEAQTTAHVREVVLDDVVQALGSNGGGLWLLTPQGLVLENRLLGSHADQSEERHPGLEPLGALHPAAEAARTGQAVFLHDAEDVISSYPALSEVIRRVNTQARAYLPLRRGQEVFGVLSLSFAEPHAWDQGERSFALTLADRAAIAFERARLHELEQRARSVSERALRSLSALQQLTARLSAALTPEEIIRAVFEQGLSTLGTGGSTVALLSPDGEELVIVDWVGHPPDAIDPWRRFSVHAKTPMGDVVHSRQPLFMSSREEALALYPEIMAAARSDHHAWAVLPLMVERRVLGAVSVAFAEAREFTQEEREFIRTLVQQCAQALERAQLFEHLAQSEERYRTLFESIDQGFCILEMIYDQDGQPSDYRFLEVNPTFERHTGLKDALGKTAKELLPDLEEEWVQTYARVAQTGELLHFEQGSLALGRWFEVDAVRVGGEGSHKVALLFTDITERKRREANLAFRAEVMEILVQPLGPGEIARQVSERIAHYLNLSHCLLVQVDEEAGQVHVLHDHHAPDLPSLEGAYQLADFHTDQELQQLAVGQTVVISDVRRSPRAASAAGFEALHIRALLTVPYVSEGRWAFALSAQHRHTYAWRADEIELLSDLAAGIYLRLERARAEEALRQSEARYRALVEASTQVVWRASADGRLLHPLERWSALTGVPPEQLKLESALEDYVHPEDREQGSQQWWDAITAKIPLSFEQRVRRADGSYRYWAVRAAPVLGDGSVLEWVGTDTDITERKQAEQVIIESEERFRSIADAAPALIWMTGLDKGRTFFNKSWLEFTGRSMAQEFGQGWMQGLHPDDLGRYLEVYNRAFAKREPFETEYRLRRHDGEYRWLVSRVIPRLTQDGEFLGLIGAAMDIHDRKQAEAALRQSEHQLRQLSEAQRRFVADASHELRAPLTAIQGNLELLQRFKNMSKVDREAALDEAASEASRLGRLVSDLLALARGDAGATIRQEPVNLSNLLQETFKELKQRKTGHQLQLQLLDSIMTLGDRDQLKQLTIILMDNALKYTPSGGEVQLSLRQQGDKALIQVSDTGIGIAPEDLPHVFERFFRADHSRHKAADPGGTGLGLPIAQWIVNQHQGSIRLDSELGKGTTATVELPLVRVHDLKN